MKTYAEAFKALADETRLTMLGLLIRYGELCVCDFEAVLQISQSKASRHLRYLKNAGFIDDRREGTWVHYKISDASGYEAMAVLKATEKLIASLLDDTARQRLAAWLEKKRSQDAAC